jgi:hypothetical protein
MYKLIANDKDHDLLQQGLTNLHQWSDKWLLELNNKKCKVMSIGRNILNKSDYSPTLDGSNLSFIQLYCPFSLEQSPRPFHAATFPKVILSHSFSAKFY